MRIEGLPAVLTRAHPRIVVTLNTVSLPSGNEDLRHAVWDKKRDAVTWRYACESQ